jgi:hypothetical protein
MHTNVCKIVDFNDAEEEDFFITLQKLIIIQ